jgi:hypothetical protein
MSDVDDLRRDLSALRARIDSLETASGIFVSDKELDGPKGSFRVPFDPKRWTGASCRGKEIRDCPPDFCEAFAEFCDWSAAHPKPRPGREQYAERDAANERRRAALCRSWARRKRSGWVPPAAGEFPGDDAGGALQPPYAPPPADDFEAPGFEAPTAADPDDIPF